MSWTGGFLSGAGGTTRVLASGTLSIAPAASVQLQTYTLELAGTGTWTGTQTINTGSVGVLRVLGGGNLAIQGDPTFSYSLGGATSSLNVLGTLSRTTSANPAILSLPVNDSGTVSVQSGTLRLAGGGTSSGAYTAATGATLDFNGGTHALGGTTSITGAGTVSFTAGNISDAGTYAVTGTSLVAGGTVAFNAASSSTGTLVVGSGTLGGAGLFTVSGPMTWTGGALSGTGGTTRVLSSGTLSLAPAGTIQLAAYTLELAGTGTWSAAQTLQTGSAAVLRVLAGANLTVSGDPTINAALGGATPLLENLGTITRTTSAGTVTVGVPFNQAGALSIQSGAVNVAAGGTMSGPVTQSSTGLLQFTNGSTTLANGFNASGGGLGITQLISGTLGGLSATDTAFFDNLQLVGGSISLAGGTIKTPFETIWSGPTTVSGGTIFIPATAGLTVSFTTGAPSLQNATILVAGAAGWTATTPLSSGSGAVIRILPGANISFSGAGGGFLYNLGGTASLFDNQGTLISAVSAGSPGATIISAPITNTGSIQVVIDTLRLSGGSAGTFPGSLTVNSGAVLEFGGSTFTLGSALSVGGSLLVSGGLLVPSGHPVAITQNFATAGSGALQMTLSTDSLGVGGNASFGGGSTSGLLTTGVLAIVGNFAQSGDAAAFAPSGTQSTRLVGSGLQTLSFLNPTTSFFNRLVLSSTVPRSVTLQTNAMVNDSLIVLGGASPTTLNGAGTSQRLTVNGHLRVTQQTSSPLVAPPVLELSLPPSVDSIFAAGAGVAPDTTVYLGSSMGAVFPTGTPLRYKSVRIATTGALADQASGLADSIRGDLVVQSGFTVSSAATPLVVTGKLRVTGSGVLTMQQAGSQVTVGDSAIFGGASESGKLTAGTLKLGGNFVEVGAGSQFASTGTRVAFQRATAGVQTIQFADPVNSFFNDLVLNRPIADTVRLLSDALANDSAIVTGFTVLSSTAFEALKIPATGTLRIPGSGAVLKPSRVEFGTLQVDSAFVGGPRIMPDTTVFLNGGFITSSSPAYAWKSVRVAGGSLSSSSTIFNGNLIISGGDYGFCAGTDSVGGFLRTEGTGALLLTCAEGETMAVRDSAVFAGGASSVSGNMRIYGSFVQRGSATSFQGDPFGVEEFAGAAAQTISFTNPDSAAAGSHFGTLLVSNAGLGVTVATKVFALGQLQTPDSIFTRRIFGSNNDLAVRGLQAGGLIFNDVPLVVDNGQAISMFGNTRWVNSNGAATQLWIRRVGGLGTTFTFPNLDFSPTLTTGLYVHLTETDINSPQLQVNLTGTTPTSTSVNFGTQTLTDGAIAPILSWLP
jgi:hypothetical protein